MNEPIREALHAPLTPPSVHGQLVGNELIREAPSTPPAPLGNWLHQAHP